MDTNRGKQKVSIEDALDAGAVTLFRSRLAEKDLLPKSQDNYHTMLRFLKSTRFSQDYDYDRAICKWEEMINWRRTNGVDTIIQDFVYKEHDDVRLFYPQGFHGVDKAGRPIYIEYTEKIDCTKLMEVTTVDRFIKSYIQECEKMVVEKFPACTEIANKPIDSLVLIIVLPTGRSNRNKDFKAYNMISLSLEQVHVAYYPQTVHQIFYINAGIRMKLLDKLNKWRHDPRKRPVGSYALGKNFRTKLLEFIDEDQLPTSLGGSCSCPGKEGGCLRFEKGPWEVPQAKDKNAEMILNKRTEIAETVQIIPRSSPETIQTYLQKPRNGLGSAVSPEAACHQCTGLKNEVNSLSSKLDKLQTTLDLLLSAQDRANCSGVAGELSRHRNDSEQLSAAEERANFAEVQGIKLKKP